MTVVFMFPGQSSREAGMIDRIVSAWPPAAQIVEYGSELLGRDLRAKYAQPAEQAFATNRDIQVGVFLSSFLHQRAIESNGIEGDLSLGLSLGEYNHLVHAGAIAFEDALRLVDARGRVYDSGPDGIMASVFPLPFDDLVRFVARARAHGVVEIANRNSPSQNVLSGERPAVEAAIRQIEEDEPAVQAVVIEQRIPMHSSLFRGVGVSLRPYLDRADWRTPSRPYMPNVTATPIESPDKRQISDLLERHVSNPVLWRESIDWIADRYPNVCFVEVGPGAVLFNLLQKRWHPNRKFRTDDLADPVGNLGRVISALRDAA